MVSEVLERGAPPGLLEALERAVAGLHRRGVFHLDLRHRSNVLVGPGSEPVLIDFASAVCLRPGGLLDSTLGRLLARIDGHALRKWRRRAASR